MWIPRPFISTPANLCLSVFSWMHVFDFQFATKMLNVQKDAFYLPLKLIATLFKAQSVKLFRRNNPYLSFHVFAV